MTKDERDLIEIANNLLDGDIKGLENINGHIVLRYSAIVVVENARRVNEILKILPISTADTEARRKAKDEKDKIINKIYKLKSVLKTVALKYDLYELYVDVVIGYHTGDFNIAHYRE